MNTIIIEDEPLTARRLENMLQKYDADLRVLAVLPSVAESIAWLKTHPDPDVIFMDIHLEDEPCFGVFERINLDVPVIFTTAYDEYMIKAFKVNSIDYLMKPVGYQDLVGALEKCKRLRQQYRQGGLEQLLQSIHRQEPEYKTRFLVTGSTKLYPIDVEKVAYFYCIDKITLLVTTDGQQLPVDYSLDRLSVLLNPKDFFRINRQMIVKLGALEKVHVYPKGRLRLDLLPAFPKEVLVSVDRITPFKEWLGK